MVQDKELIKSEPLHYQNLTSTNEAQNAFQSTQQLLDYQSYADPTSYTDFQNPTQPEISSLNSIPSHNPITVNNDVTVNEDNLSNQAVDGLPVSNEAGDLENDDYLDKSIKRPRTTLTNKQRQLFRQTFEVTPKPCRKVSQTIF